MGLPLNILPPTDGWTITVDLGGATITLPPAQKADLDQQTGNVTFGWDRPRDFIEPLLVGHVARNVQQSRTRLGTFGVISDPGAVLVRLSWTRGTNVELTDVQTLTCVLVLPQASFTPSGLQQSLVAYRADVLYIRGSGSSSTTVGAVVG